MKQSAILADRSRLGKLLFIAARPISSIYLILVTWLSSIVYTLEENDNYDCGQPAFFDFLRIYLDWVSSIASIVEWSFWNLLANGTVVAFVFGVESEKRCHPRCWYLTKKDRGNYVEEIFD